MFSRLFRRSPDEPDLGLGLKPGAGHYRAYVGPPRDYDLIAAMVFNLLTCLGLRQHHRVLDIGCGSLRVGRLLIPYLNPGQYFGVEPNRWLVRDGIRNEVGRDQIRLKRPTFSFATDLEAFREPLGVEFAVAQSILSHTGPDLTRHWLSQVAAHLRPDGALLATFVRGDSDWREDGWFYDICVDYTSEGMERFAHEAGLGFRMLDWAHPRQTWAVFAGPEYDWTWVDDGPIHWNRAVERAGKTRGASG